MIADYVPSGFFCSIVQIPNVVTPFISNYRRRIFFSSVRITIFCSTIPAKLTISTVLFLTKPPRLPIHPDWRKGISFFLPYGGSGLQPPTTPLPLYAGC